MASAAEREHDVQIHRHGLAPNSDFNSHLIGPIAIGIAEGCQLHVHDQFNGHGINREKFGIGRLAIILGNQRILQCVAIRIEREDGKNQIANTSVTARHFACCW